MKYKYRNRKNPFFPFGKRHKSKKKTASSCDLPKVCLDSHCNKKNSPLLGGVLDSILKPIEKAIGREIVIDDLLLIGIILLIMTNKDEDDYTLLICLGFILLG